MSYCPSGTSSVVYIDPETDEEYEIVFDWWYAREYDDEPPGYDFEIVGVFPPSDKDFREYVCENADWANLRFE